MGTVRPGGCWSEQDEQGWDMDGVRSKFLCQGLDPFGLWELEEHTSGSGEGWFMLYCKQSSPPPLASGTLYAHSSKRALMPISDICAGVPAQYV